jgi:calcium-translocating P-type ATPase
VAEERAVAWHALPAPEVASLLETTERGLTTHQAQARQRRYGRNELAEEPPPSALVVLGRQFQSPLIYILVVAAFITLALREFIDAGVITAVVLINALIGFVQERKADRAVRALTQMVVPIARGVRDGQEREIDSRELVPGDLVLLEPGGRVPADIRLTRVTALEVDESMLTGESVPIRKHPREVEATAALADRRSMVYTGAVVTSGRGRGVVVATGAATELGEIAGLIRGERITATPLQVRMGRFAHLIGAAVAVGALLAFGSGIALGGEIGQMFLTAVALAVAAIPEGLPIALTVALALGVHRMAKRNAIVRRLPAVETLGSTTVIGSDKTGTLTENRMTVQEIWTAGRFHGPGDPAPEASELHQVLLTGVLTNEADATFTAGGQIRASGDPTEVALLTAAMASGVVPDEVRDDYATFAEIPFEPERRYSASVREVDGSHLIFVKGAPERVMDMCTRMLTGHGEAPLDRAAIAEAAASLAGRGLRVLAMASRRLPAPLARPEEVAEPEGLVFLGLQGMLDPPRVGVSEAVADCQRAGIRVVMITGDHASTARAIATKLGIADEGAVVITGGDLDRLSDDELRQRVADVAVYARVTPADKLRVVHALQHNGEVVAVTGDGVNDAPALRAAAIGVAMGRSGTDVAREAADMVLADDNFVTIAAAVEEGRVTFDNVRKVSFFLVSTGAATITAILVGLWLGWPLLMLPAQLLWLNLVTNGLQDKALAFEPGEKGLLDRAPRSPGEGIISGVLWWRIALVGAVMAAGTLVMFNWELERSGSLPQAQTVALTTMVVFMAFHLGNARVERESALRVNPLANPFLLLSAAAALAVHVAALYAPPTQWLLRVEPIDAAAWVRIVAIGVTVVVVVEIEKLVRRLHARQRWTSSATPGVATPDGELGATRRPG